MLDNEIPGESTTSTDGDTSGDAAFAAAPVSEDAAPATKAAARKTTRKAPARATAKTAAKTAAKKTTRKAVKKTAAPATDEPDPVDEAQAPASEPAAEPAAETVSDGEAPPKKTARKTAARKTTAKRASKKTAAAEGESGTPVEAPAEAPVEAPVDTSAESTDDEPARSAVAPLFQAPDASAAKPTRKRAARKRPAKAEDDAVADEQTAAPEDSDTSVDAEPGDDSSDGDAGDDAGTRRRPRRRGGRRRRKGGGDAENGSDDGAEDGTEGAESDDSGDDASEDGGGSSSSASRRRRRRRRSGDDGDGSSDDPANTVTRVRKPRNPEDEITALQGSTRLEAKKQRRREGREAGRRRAPIVSEAEFLARREAVDRVMVIRQRDDLTQIGVLEDKVLVEHYVARESQTSLIGNVYLGRVQNVLPSMEAAFIDIGKGRNAVLYAGEVNWKALGAKDGQPRKIESVLKSGQPILVQVTKDPIGHKGARLTSQVSLPGRFLVYVPDGTTSGISRKLPDTERNRLKTLLKEIVPDTAGVIVRTAAEGASEDELTLDVERLTARWADIEAKVKAGNSPALLYGEPDLTLKVVRDLFTEDFTKLVVQGDDAWDLVDNYVKHVAPDLQERLERYRPDDEDNDGRDLFAAYRVDEQIAKGVDRKVWLPSGGSLIIDRTEAMTVVDVNTGKFTGSGGNLEETVTKNNLEAAEEIVRQLRLRDIGGIIVVDFIDMVLESNRDLVLRRMVECLGRDRTRHQVAEVTSLGLVQMTRKRIGTGLLEAFSEECSHCKGRGLLIHEHPIEPSTKMDDDDRRGGRRGRSGGRARATGPANGGSTGGSNGGSNGGNGHAPSPRDVAAMARDHADKPPADVPEDEADEQTDEQPTDQSLEHASDDATQSPAEATVEVESVTEVVAHDQSEPTSETQPETQPEPQPEPDVVAEPEPPKLVTSTRRRSARRAAGPPAAVPAPDGTPEPEADAGIDAGAEDGDETVDGVEHDEHGFVLHVPVKRKGSRRR